MAERYFSELVEREKDGKGDEDVDGIGLNASSGPRDGVIAVKTPEGEAVRKVPLGHGQLGISRAQRSNAL